MDKDVNSKIEQLITTAMSDDVFKSQLIENPVAVFKAAGIEFPAGLEIKVLENSDTLFHLVLPQNPAELSDEDLDVVAGGGIPIIGL